MDVGNRPKRGALFHALVVLVAGLGGAVGLALTLVFVGAKMLLSEVAHVPVEVSPLAIGVSLGTSSLTSLRAAIGEPLPDVAREAATVDV